MGFTILLFCQKRYNLSEYNPKITFFDEKVCMKIGKLYFGNLDKLEVP